MSVVRAEKKANRLCGGDLAGLEWGLLWKKWPRNTPLRRHTAPPLTNHHTSFPRVKIGTQELTAKE